MPVPVVQVVARRGLNHMLLDTESPARVFVRMSVRVFFRSRSRGVETAHGFRCMVLVFLFFSHSLGTSTAPCGMLDGLEHVRIRHSRANDA